MTRTVIVLAAAVLTIGGLPVHSWSQLQQYGLTVSVSENRGRAVTGLGPSDFRVRVGDLEPRVVSVEPDPRPVAIVIIVDGVIAEEALHARAALTTLLTRLREAPGTRVGLMLGDGGAHPPVLQDAIEGGDDLRRRVSRFFRSEVTAPPQDMLEGAIVALRREETHRRVALVLSVNRRAGRVQIPPSLISAFVQSGVMLVAVEASTAVSGTNQDPSLQLIHASVGGVFERVPDVSALESVGLRLTSTALSAYRVVFEAAESPRGYVQVSVPSRPRALISVVNWVVRQ